MYFPESWRATWRPSNLPSRSYRKRCDQREASGRIHVTVGCGFPVAEHWKTALRFSLTVWFMGDITTVGVEIDSPGSPFAPGNPLGPGSPFTPRSPLGPGGPVSPCFPCGPRCPVRPRDPFLPMTPRGPLLPRDPLGPCIPGGPCTHICSLDEQIACGFREFKVLFISLLTVSIVSLWSSGLIPTNRRVLNLWIWTDDKIK